MKRAGITFPLFILAVLLLGVLCVCLGSSRVAPAQFFDADWSLNPVIKLRIFRVLAAFTVGGSLALAGAAYQAVLRNPLAEPFILGVSGGAAIGAALGFITGLASLFLLAVPIMALLGSLIALSIVIWLSRGGKNGVTRLLLSGVIVGTMSSSVLSCLISFATVSDLCGINWWLLGDLQSVDLKILTVAMAALAAGAVILFLWSFKANAVSLGHDHAWNVGVNPVTTSVLLIVTASILTSCTVALSGIIGFVGLVIPHIFRRSTGADNRKLFMLSLLGGGMFLMLCDLLSRIIYPAKELPIGVITALIGGPMFLWLLNKNTPGES